MAEQERWTQEQDQQLRAALGTLRHDVEAQPLPDVRFVMARGNARRRRRISIGAAAAAAVLVLGYTGVQQLDPDASLAPAATVSPVAPDGAQADPSRPLAIAGPPPLSAEWGRALGSTGVVRLVPAPSDQPVPGPCPATAPGERVRAEDVRAEPAGWNGEQSLYRASSASAGDRAVETMLTRVMACNGTAVTTQGSGSEWPRILLIRGGAGVQSWVAVAHSGADTSVLAVSGTIGDQQVARKQVGDLASVAQQRLEQTSGADLSRSPGGPAPTATPPAAGPTTGSTGGSTDDEPMHVVGPRPLLDGALFVPASAWSAPGLTHGAATRSVTGDWEGQAAISNCDADTAQDGAPGAGRFGIVSVATATDGTFVGRQRVRLTSDDAAATAERDRLVQALRTCAARVEGMTVTPDPDHAGAFRLDFDNPHGGPVITTWVAVTTQRTTGAVSTFALTGGVPGDEGFSQLQRLVSLAGQR
jgi:hypothetical protein